MAKWDNEHFLLVFESGVFLNLLTAIRLDFENSSILWISCESFCDVIIFSCWDKWFQNDDLRMLDLS